MTRKITISRSAVAECAGAPRSVALISYFSCLACLRSCTYASSRSKLSFQNRSNPPVHSWTGRSPRASRPYRRCLPALRSRTSPTSRSTRRCLDAPGWVIPSSWANSVTGPSPARSSIRISRRCCSAIALKTSDVVAARAMAQSYSDIGIRQAGGIRRVLSDDDRDQEAGRLLVLEELLELLRPLRVAQFSERLGFDLANAFACHPELAADLLKGLGLTVDETEPHAHDFLFAFAQL